MVERPGIFVRRLRLINGSGAAIDVTGPTRGINQGLGAASGVGKVPHSLRLSAAMDAAGTSGPALGHAIGAQIAGRLRGGGDAQH